MYLILSFNKLRKKLQKILFRVKLIKKTKKSLMTTSTKPASKTPLLFDKFTIDLCPWPEGPEGEYAKRFLTPFIKKGVGHFINNIKTDLRILVGEKYVVPLSINEGEDENSFVCSPYNYYISYGAITLNSMETGWTKPIIQGMLRAMGKVLKRYEINRVVVVNNWFFSTNLYPQLTPEQLEEIAKFLRAEFPNHALIFRSVDPSTNPVCFQTLTKIGFDYIANRQIFYIDQTTQKTLFESRLFKSDLRLLEKSGYEILDGKEVAENEIPRLVELYQNLYLKKYSELNPQLNESFVSLALKQNLMQFKALKKNGRIDGVIGYMMRDGKMFCPFFGYDRTLPKEAGLYRNLSTVLMLEAGKHNLFFHLSSGASMFKTIRKGVGCMEYMAVDYRHLGYARQFPWRLLKGLCNTIGVFYMKRI